jgi:hypothetical protein
MAAGAVAVAMPNRLVRPTTATAASKRIRFMAGDLLMGWCPDASARFWWNAIKSVRMLERLSCQVVVLEHVFRYKLARLGSQSNMNRSKVDSKHAAVKSITDIARTRWLDSIHMSCLS